MFADLWFGLFSLFETVMDSFRPILGYLQMDYLVLARKYNAPDWIINIIESIMDWLGLSSASILSLMLGAGIPIFIVLAVAKFFSDLIRG